MSEPDIPAWFNQRGVQCSQAPNLRETLTFEPVIRIFGSVQLGRVSIGAYSYLSPRATLNNVTVGRYCSIGDRCTIGPSQHPTSWLTTSPIAYKTVFNNTMLPSGAPQHEELSEVQIGNDVWIGADSAIMGGVTIGDGAIIAYGSVVTKDVPPYAIVGGTPARLIRMRFAKDVLDSLIASRWWRYDLVQMRGRAPNWSDPGQAIGQLQRKVADGEVTEISCQRHCISRRGANTFAFKKLV